MFWNAEKHIAFFQKLEIKCSVGVMVRLWELEDNWKHNVFDLSLRLTNVKIHTKRWRNFFGLPMLLRRVLRKMMKGLRTTVTKSWRNQIPDPKLVIRPLIDVVFVQLGHGGLETNVTKSYTTLELSLALEFLVERLRSNVSVVNSSCCISTMACLVSL